MAKYIKRYKDHEEFDEAVERYVLDCKTDEVPLTITGLTLSLGFSSRNSLNTYEKDPEFKASVQRARLLIENQYEKNLTQRGVSPVGSIFALKNIGAWADKQTVELAAEEDFFSQVFKIADDKRKKREEELG